jgi:hypothetical protein
VILVAGLCAAQVVALAAASRGVSGGRAGVRDALGRCGPGAALACLAGVAAGTAASLGSPAFAKQFGLAAAAGCLLELLVVQALLAPALLRLTARAGSHQ